MVLRNCRSICHTPLTSGRIAAGRRPTCGPITARSSPPAFDEDLSSVSKRSRLRHSPAVLPPPAVIRGLSHAEAARHLRDRCPLRERQLRLPQFADDLVGYVPLAGYGGSLLPAAIFA